MKRTLVKVTLAALLITAGTQLASASGSLPPPTKPPGPGLVR